MCTDRTFWDEYLSSPGENYIFRVAAATRALYHSPGTWSVRVAFAPGKSCRYLYCRRVYCSKVLYMFVESTERPNILEEHNHNSGPKQPEKRRCATRYSHVPKQIRHPSPHSLTAHLLAQHYHFRPSVHFPPLRLLDDPRLALYHKHEDYNDHHQEQKRKVLVQILLHRE